MAGHPAWPTVPCMSATPRVVVVGGGIAALETTLALRDLAGDRVAVTLIAAEPDLVLRPLLMGGHSGSVALRDVAAELDVELRTARVSAVRPEQRQVWLSGGDAVAYDTLVLAPGARSLA